MVPVQLRAAEPAYDIELTAATKLFKDGYCWVHPRVGVIPPHTPGNDSPQSLAVMTLQRASMGGSDVFYELCQMRTIDGGRTWDKPMPIAGFERRPHGKGQEITLCDFTPRWHAASGKLLGTGQTIIYENNKVMPVRPRATVYAVYDPLRHTWSPWQELQMPPGTEFANAGAGSTQRWDLPNGDILLPIYFKPMEGKQYAATVVRCRFDGTTLTYIEHGTELTINEERGLVEPSLTQFAGRFYLTLRNDRRGYVTTSADGLHFDPPRPWTWDDGTDLGNYNTQQHWVMHPSKGLYLTYTRRGADNDHVFRHRAPMFIAQVDPVKLHVIRATERILMPNRGARLGNFGVTEVSAQETWVSDSEWMQPEGVEKYGADGSVWVSKINWK